MNFYPNPSPPYNDGTYFQNSMLEYFPYLLNEKNLLPKIHTDNRKFINNLGSHLKNQRIWSLFCENLLTQKLYSLSWCPRHASLESCQPTFSENCLLYT